MNTYDTSIQYKIFHTRYDTYRISYNIDNYNSRYSQNPKSNNLPTTNRTPIVTKHKRCPSFPFSPTTTTTFPLNSNIPKNPKHNSQPIKKKIQENHLQIPKSSPNIPTFFISPKKTKTPKKKKKVEVVVMENSTQESRFRQQSSITHEAPYPLHSLVSVQDLELKILDCHRFGPKLCGQFQKLFQPPSTSRTIVNCIVNLLFVGLCCV